MSAARRAAGSSGAFGSREEVAPALAQLRTTELQAASGAWWVQREEAITRASAGVPYQSNMQAHALNTDLMTLSNK